MTGEDIRIDAFGAERPFQEDRILARVRACLDKVREAYSESTERALFGDMERFMSWCAPRGLCPLPADETALAAWVADLERTHAPATVQRYVSSIVNMHRAAGEENPLQGSEVKYSLRRMRRRRGRRQKQVLGLTWALRRRLTEAAGHRLIDLRDKAILAVSYDSMVRRSELVALQVSDLMLEIDGTAVLLVRGGKTDPERRGALQYLHRDSVRLLRAWLRESGVNAGPLFRSVGKAGNTGASLHASQLPRIYKKMARHAGLPERVVQGLSGHSPRVGAAQDMIASGIEMPAILQAGRWKTPAMVQRYGERLLAQRSAAAKLARLQKRK